jgi:hypothetical protein
MKRSLWFLLVLLVVPGVPVSAQVVFPDRDVAVSPRKNVFGLGLFGGPASGLGLSFRHHLPTPFSYQINGGVIKVDDRLAYSVGAEVQYDLTRTGVTRFFVAGATSYFYKGKAEQNDIAGPGRLGIGIGGELHADAGIHVTVDLLFTYFSDGTVLPLPQIGFHYYFR